MVPEANRLRSVTARFPRGFSERVRRELVPRKREISPGNDNYSMYASMPKGIVVGAASRSSKVMGNSGSAKLSIAGGSNWLAATLFPNIPTLECQFISQFAY